MDWQSQAINIDYDVSGTAIYLEILSNGVQFERTALPLVFSLLLACDKANKNIRCLIYRLTHLPIAVCRASGTADNGLFVLDRSACAPTKVTNF